MRNISFYKRVIISVAFILASTIPYAQNVGVGTLNPLARLHVADSNVLFSATGPLPATVGNPPVSGKGRRLMWYADKAAFRVGYVTGSQWDKDSIGDYSIGMGYNTKAKGSGAIALGIGSEARGSYASALGASALANGTYATALTYGEATGSYSVAMGNGALASGFGSIAAGENAMATGNNSISIGKNTLAPTYEETALGLNNADYVPFNTDNWDGRDRLLSIGNGQTVGTRSNALTILKNGNVAIGNILPSARLHVADSNVLFSATGPLPATFGNPPISGKGRRLLWYADKAAFRVGYVSSTQWDKDSIGTYSVGMGYDAKAKGSGSIALGTSSEARGIYASALGTNAQANGTYSTAFTNAEATGTYSVAMVKGSLASGYGSIAAGEDATATGSNTISLGKSTLALTYAETALGIYNSSYTPYNAESWDARDRIFSIGNGQSDATRNNALTILKNGNIGIGTSTPHAQLQFSNATSNRKVVFYEQADNDHQYYGLGVNGGILRYQVNDVIASHIFYAATSATTSNELMRIQGNGRVGIGTNAPDQLLTVNGNASKPGGGTWATFSDGRLKKNVTDYTAGLDEILAIHPVSFQYNELSGYSDTDARYVGIIAQEIEKVLPATISVMEGDEKVKDKRQFDGSELTYTLVNAIKQEHAQVETLHKENELLKARLAAIEKALGIK